MKLFLLCFGMVTLLSPLPASAWDSEVHIALIQLTRNIGTIPGVANSERYFVPKEQAGEMCYSYRGTLTDPLRRVYLDLVCGTDEPDHYRHFWENNDHQVNAQKHVADNFNAAVSTFRQSATLGNAAFSESARLLGNSIHFIQDLTDFSKNKESGSDSSRIRELGIEIAQNWLREWQNTGQYPAALGSKVDAMRAELQGDPAPQTIEELVQGAYADRVDMAQTVQDVLNHPDPDDQRPRDDKLRDIVVTTLAGSIVVQEYVVDTYLRYIAQ